MNNISDTVILKYLCMCTKVLINTNLYSLWSFFICNICALKSNEMWNYGSLLLFIEIKNNTIFFVVHRNKKKNTITLHLVPSWRVGELPLKVVHGTEQLLNAVLLMIYDALARSQDKDLNLSWTKIQRSARQTRVFQSQEITRLIGRRYIESES